MRNKKFTFILYAAGALLVLFIFLEIMQGASFVQNTILRVTSPFTSAFIKVTSTISGIWQTVADMRNVYTEIELLRNENQQLLALRGSYEDLKKENELLRNQLQVPEPPQLTLAEARVVSYDPLSAAHFVLIDKGERDGITVGMPVVRPGNVLVGKISGTYSAFSHVALISEKTNKVAVKSALKDATGLLTGAAGNLLSLELVEKSAVLEVGDLLVTSGLDGIYPKNLIVGWVKEIDEKEEEIFKQAYVRPAFAGFAHTQVFVITNYLR